MAFGERKYGWGERIVMPFIWCAGRLGRTRVWKWLWNLASRRSNRRKKKLSVLPLPVIRR